jgi:hypothetical protein
MIRHILGREEATTNNFARDIITSSQSSAHQPANHLTRRSGLAASCRKRTGSLTGRADMSTPETVVPAEPPLPLPQDTSAIAARIRYEEFSDETQLPAIVALIEKDLSEPYSVYTYRYFIHGWPKLCVLAKDGDVTVGVVVCKADRGNRK